MNQYNEIEFVCRCKNKTDLELHSRIHASDGERTFCGKELNDMWYFLYGEKYTVKNIQSITCPACKKIIKNKMKNHE